MIAKRFGFTRDFLMERNTGLYYRLKKIPCGFKNRARACLLMDFPGSVLDQILPSSPSRRSTRKYRSTATHAPRSPKNPPPRSTKTTCDAFSRDITNALP